MLSFGKQSDSAVRSNDRSCGSRKLCASFPLVQFLICEMVGILMAGIVVPSIFWSRVTTGRGLAARSLRHLALGGISFQYTYHDIEFAILGAVLGTVGAWAGYARGKFALKPRAAHTPGQRHSTLSLFSRRHWRTGVSKAA
jgi:hypothetical protein